VHQSLFELLTSTAVDSKTESKSNSKLNSKSKSKSTDQDQHNNNNNNNNNNKVLPITSKEIQTLFTKLPSKKPSNAEQYISLIEYLLIDNFHSSCDSRLNTEVRTHCLQKIKYLFLAVDTASVEHSKEEQEKVREKEERERERERERQLLEKKAREAREASAARDKLLQEQNKKMGSLFSTNSNTNAGANVGANSTGANGQNEVIILDGDTPPPSPQKQTHTATAQDPSSSFSSSSVAAATATTTTTTTATNTGGNNSNAVVISANTAVAALAETATAAKLAAAATAQASTSTSTSDSKPTSTFHFVPSTKIPPSQAYVPNTKIKKYRFLHQHQHQNQNQNQPNTQIQTHRPASLTFLPDQKTIPNNPNSHTTSFSLSHRSRCEVVINTAFISCEAAINQLKKMTIPPPPLTQYNFQNVSSALSVYLDGLYLTEFRSRLMKWDPYWNVICDCSSFTTNTTDQKSSRNESQNQNHAVEVGYKTTNVISTKPDTSRGMGMDHTGEIPRTACHLPIHFANMFNMKNSNNNNNSKNKNSNTLLYEQVAWGQSRQNTSSNHNIQYTDGEKRMLIRALPIIPNPKYKKIRSDTHQWPKGTFVQLDSQILYPVSQRKQQQHDAKLWKGLSYAYDITENLNLNTIMYNHKNKVPTILSFCCKDTEMYALQVAICEYISPNSLFDICMSSGTKGSITKMDYKDGLSKAMKHFEKETLVLDSDDDEGGTSSNGKNTAAGIDNLTCSLICPVSMQKIETPVRGRNCKHLNCFDLRTYLHSNSKVSGGRWRCYVCEDFVSVDDLVYDGFIAQVLETHGKDINTATRDKMQLKNDGTWKLLDEASSSMKRNQKKRKMKENTGSAKRPKNGSGGAQTGGTEVIDID